MCKSKLIIEWIVTINDNRETLAWRHWVQVVLLRDSRKDGTLHLVREGGPVSTEQWLTITCNLQASPLYGDKVGWSESQPHCTLSTGSWLNMIWQLVRACAFVCVRVHVCRPPADECQASLAVSATNVRSLKFQHQGQGHHLTPLFLFTHFAWYVSTGSGATSLSTTINEWGQICWITPHCNGF